MDTVNFNKLNKRHLAFGLNGLRKVSGYTLEDLADYTGKDTAYLSRLENGKTSPKMETISNILSFYNMTIKDFYDKLDEFI